LASIAAAYNYVFAPATRRKNAALAKTFINDLEQMHALLSVPTLQELDQVRLRILSEDLANDLAMLGLAIGLEKPGLGN